MTMKTKRLSTDSDFSIRYALKNSSARSLPNQCQTSPLKHRLSTTHTTDQVSASFVETDVALRWNTPRSSASMMTTPIRKETHNVGEPTVWYKRGDLARVDHSRTVTESALTLISILRGLDWS